MPERCRICGDPLPDDPDWTTRTCPKCIEGQDRRRFGESTSLSLAQQKRSIARAPGTCAECGVPLLSDERERGICGACLKRSKFNLIHSQKTDIDRSLPPTRVGWVGHWKDILDERPEPESPLPPDWQMGYSTFTKDIEGSSYLTVLQFHMNGGKAVVIWRSQEEVMCLRFEEQVTRGFKSFGDRAPESYLLLPNGLCVQGSVNVIHNAMTAREVEMMVRQNRDQLLDPKGWGAGKFRKKIPMLVFALSRSGKLEAPSRPALEHHQQLVDFDGKTASGGDEVGDSET